MSRYAVVAVATYVLAGAGGVICARQWEHLATLWGLTVLVYAAILFDGRLVRLLPKG